jgi:cytochrome c biogenesis protein CcmG/thiol:disulfide interchange protein DsbE
VRTLAFAFALLTVAVSTAAADQPPAPGAVAPAFTLPVIANGKGDIVFSSLRGRGVYLSFFASWCDPCKAEAPWLAKMAKRYAKRNVVTIGVDELDETPAALAFTRKFHLPYAIVSDVEGRLGASYGIAALPLHVFIAPDGRIAAEEVGPLSQPKLEADMGQIAARR